MASEVPRHAPVHVVVLGALVALAATVALGVLAWRTDRPPACPALPPARVLPPAPDLAVDFVGNAGVPSRELRAVVAAALHHYGPPYAREALDYTALELSVYYWDRGYAAVSVDPARVDPVRGTLGFTVHEGPVFTLSAIDVRGVPPAEAAADRALLHERRGSRYSRRAALDDRQALEARYGDAGHAFAASDVRTEQDLAHRTLALTFWIDPGPRVRIGRVAVRPHGRATPEAMRRALTVAPGQWYTQAALLDSKRRLEALGLGDVAVSTEHGALPTLVDVAFELVADP